MNEQSKATERRKKDSRYSDRWITGRVLDVGCGDDPLKLEDWPKVKEVVPYDKMFGNADGQFLPELADGEFDTVHGSHVLEHFADPRVAFVNWMRVLRPGGFIVATIPDELLYEGGVWPSRFNADHKNTFSLRYLPIRGDSVNLIQMLYRLPLEIEMVQLLSQHWSPALVGQDQTLGRAECAIEVVVRSIGRNVLGKKR